MQKQYKLNWNYSSTLYYEPLCITALESNSKVELINNGTESTPLPIANTAYSFDKINWVTFTPQKVAYGEWGDNVITLSNIGDKVYFKNDITGDLTLSLYGLKFQCAGKLKASGNINSIYKSTEWWLVDTLVYKECFAGLFAGQNSLVDVEELLLPATTLSPACYQVMFAASDISKAPELPATTLADYCYYDMFTSCDYLNYIKINYEGNFNSSYFRDWVSGVSATGDFYYNGSDTTRGSSAIPVGWTVHTF